MEEAIQKQDVEAVLAAAAAMKPGKPSKEQDREVQIDCERLLRRNCLQLVSQNAPDNDLKNYIDFVIECCKQDLSSRSQLATILQDIFDVISVEKAEKLFYLIEDLTPTWKSAFFESCRNHVLRLCNDLLKRLSQTLHTGFCGRILIFLARCLPLTEKSGLNLISQFNTDNVTRFADQQSQEQAGVSGSGPSTAEVLQVVDMEEGEMHDSHIPVDYALYCKFWQLQEFFSSPTNCYDRVSWKKFQHNAYEVLTAMASYKLEDVTSSSNKRLANSEGGADPRIEGVDSKTGDFEVKMEADAQVSEAKRRRSSLHPTTDGSQTFYFAKYLTSQKLLQLQLNDSQFRRYFLVQCLILYQYLTADLKWKDSKKHVLSDDQTKWVEDMTEKCYKLLRETHPDGNYFAKVIQHLIEREERWSDWKNRGCPDFTTPAFGKDKMNALRKRPRLDYDTSKLDLGNAELTKLWTIEPNNLAACRSDQRSFIPSLEEFLDDPLEELDPDQQVDDEYKSINQELFQWRACRLLSVDCTQFFQTSMQPPPKSAGNKEFVGINDFLQDVITKTAQTIPKFRERAHQKKEEKQKRMAEEALEREKLKEEESNKEAENPEAANEIDTNVMEDANDLKEALVSESQIKQLAPLISDGWESLANVLEFTKETIDSYKKKSEASVISELILSQWAEGEGEGATVKKLRNLILQAELFDEQVASILASIEAEVEEQSTAAGEANVDAK